MSAHDFAEVCPNVFQHLHISPHLIYVVSITRFEHLGQNSDNSSGANRVYQKSHVHMLDLMPLNSPPNQVTWVCSTEPQPTYPPPELFAILRSTNKACLQRLPSRKTCRTVTSNDFKIRLDFDVTWFFLGIPLQLRLVFAAFKPPQHCNSSSGSGHSLPGMAPRQNAEKCHECINLPKPETRYVRHCATRWVYENSVLPSFYAIKINVWASLGVYPDWADPRQTWSVLGIWTPDDLGSCCNLDAYVPK